MISIKEGVRVRGVQPEMMLAVSVVASVFEKYNNADCVITAARDGRHILKSLHYVGYALDFRTRHVATGWHEKIARDIQRALGNEYDVILEKNHIHVEYDPT